MKMRTRKMAMGGASGSPVSAFEQEQAPSYGSAGLGNNAPLVQVGSDVAGAGMYPSSGMLNIGNPVPTASPMTSQALPMRSGGSCGMKRGGKVRGGGCETKGKTKGRFV
jgi:hypothetical protein